MRDYATIAPQFWSGETGRALRRAGPNALLVAMYLLTTPHSNAFGLYYMPMMYLAHDLNLRIDDAQEAMDCCIRAGFCAYDSQAEVVWVRNMARFQVGERISPKDNRAAWVAREWAKLPKCDLLDEFRAQYAEAYGMADSPSAMGEQGGGQAPSKPLGKPLSQESRSPLPSPLDSPSATGGEGEGEAPPPDHEHEHEQDNKNIINIPIGETVNDRRARSPERGREGVGADLSGPGLEFVELREFYNREMRAEGPLAGFSEYKQLKAARDMTGASLWPGNARLFDDLSARKEAGVWNQGFEIGLGRYLREKTWLAPIQSRASPPSEATPTEFQRHQQDRRNMMRIARDLRERERAAKQQAQGVQHGQRAATATPPAAFD